MDHYLIGRIAGTDFMGLLNLDLALDGHSIRLVGKNRSGKSSGLNLISAALEGLDRRKRTAWGEQPVRRGDPQPDKALAELTLIGPDGEDVMVRREFKVKDGEKVVSSVEIIRCRLAAEPRLCRRLDRLTDEFEVVREDFQARISTVQGAMLVTFPVLKDIGFKHVNALRR